MKKIAFTFFPILLAGFVISNNNVTEKPSAPADEKIYDGPYVLYRNNQVYVKYVLGDSGNNTIRVDSMPMAERAGLTLTVPSDEPGKTFTVRLKDKLQEEKSEFKKVKKQLVISDIEGHFYSFRMLLQNSGVMDADYNWTFGDGHLVLVGDFFDRGTQVTELLWLIYSLEDKAKAAGGYVHFIMGNHEIMNLSGDLRYLPTKYVKDAILLNENYVGSLYGEKSELGEWLRTKNIAEKIGNTLYIHAGISAHMNYMDISLRKLNEISRPFYPDSNYVYKDQRLDIIFGDMGPFWYRGYYKATKTSPIAPISQIDSTLEKFNVKHINTGHTVIADTISILYGGKLINTDVHHAGGHSEALLIEDDKYYRVKMDGKKFPVMN